MTAGATSVAVGNPIAIGATSLPIPELGAIALGDGSFVAVFPSATGNGVLAQRHASDGTPIGAPIQVTAPNQPGGSGFALALAGGGFLIAYAAPGGTLGQIYDAHANAVGGSFPIATSSLADLSFAALANGGFIAASQERSSTGAPDGNVSAQSFDASGNPAGAAFRVNASNPSTAVLPQGSQGGGASAVSGADGSVVSPPVRTAASS